MYFWNPGNEPFKIRCITHLVFDDSKVSNDNSTKLENGFDNITWLMNRYDDIDMMTASDSDV